MHLLLIEDNPIDARATLRGVKQWSIEVEVEHITDGDSAIARLTDPTAVRPNLIFLDLNLPGSDGHDVLRTVKTDPALRRIPVIVMTTSSSEHDINQSYDLGANAFMTKPDTIDAWSQALECIERFWGVVATTPTV